MRNLFLIMLATVLFVGCGSKVQEREMEGANVWLLKIGQPVEEVKEILNAHHYPFIEASEEMISSQQDEDAKGIYTGALFGKEAVVEFKGIDWDAFTVFIDNDTVKAVSFHRSDPIFGSGAVSLGQMQYLLMSLDDEYGEHRLNRTRKSEGIIEYTWREKPVGILLRDMFNHESLVLGFSTDTRMLK